MITVLQYIKGYSEEGSDQLYFMSTHCSTRRIYLTLQQGRF